MTRLPIIRRIKPNTFNVGESLTNEDVARIKAYMWREFQIDWKAPGKVIVIEPSKDMPQIMQQPPVGRQAIVGGR